MTPGDRNYIITLTLMDGKHHVLMVRKSSEIAPTIQPHQYRSAWIDEWAFNWPEWKRVDGYAHT